MEQLPPFAGVVPGSSVPSVAARTSSVGTRPSTVRGRVPVEHRKLWRDAPWVIASNGRVSVDDEIAPARLLQNSPVPDQCERVDEFQGSACTSDPAILTGRVR